MNYKCYKESKLMMKTVKNIDDITLNNLKNGEVTLNQLNQLYNELGFIFIANKGKFTKIQKEFKHKVN